MNLLAYNSIFEEFDHKAGRSFAVLKFGIDLLGPYNATIPSDSNNLKASTISS